VLFSGLRILDEVDLVLQDEDVLQLHDLDRGQVLGRLGLRARLVSGCRRKNGLFVFKSYDQICCSFLPKSFERFGDQG
jgi:hypothetical protein